MSKIKIKELSDQMSLEVKDILSKCKELSIIARTQSSSISLDDAKKIKIALVGEPILRKPKDENDIIKRSGSKVTIRRKKKEPSKKTEEIKKSETQLQDSKTENLDPGNVPDKNRDDNPISKEKVITKAQVVETVNRKVIRTLDNTSEPSKKPKINNKFKEKNDDRENILNKNVVPKELNVTPLENDQKKKKDTATQDKDINKQKKKVKVKPTNAEIIDEDALDALRSAVKAKLPGARKEFLVSNNYPKKVKQKDNTKDSDVNDISANDSKEEKKKTKKIKIQEKILISLLANKMNVKINEVIKKASDLGLSLTFKDEIDSDEATIIASEFDYDVDVDTFNEKEFINKGVSFNNNDISSRPPIITVMGHVDHGKTSLLDYIRKAKVATSEHGGITQSIGAYSFEFKNKKLVFIDTPGHAAFSAMRSRGASLTDIVILVVAADDGIMPQTVEAINHAKSANVPIIVAINKIDKPDANIENIKSQLSENELTPDDWGGNTSCVPVSALDGTGIDELLELISIQSDLLELKANNKVPANGFVLESYLDKGRGVVATLIPKEGEIKRGDFIICGTNSGKVRAVIDDIGIQVKNSGPSLPIEILGLDGVPDAGLPFHIVKNDKVAKEVIRNRLDAIKEEESFRSHTVGLDFINSEVLLGKIKELPVIVKADTQGSLDALISALNNFESDKCKSKIVHSAVGSINESDHMLAESTGSIILGFSTIVENDVKKLLEKSGVRCETYEIIYEILDRIKELLEGLLDPILEERIVGHAEIKEVFNLTKKGKIAGCYVQDGKAIRGYKFRVMRDNEAISEGPLDSLKRFKDDVKEVASGFECGIGVDDSLDIKQGDILEIFTHDKIAQTI
ncbi:translation initiation factor IF-2 [bacterium]|nr:translation initiation factor IF-2 [bacterium]|tara:strand:+ start:1618 stop:4194 length:2577 start_codon:yes stop_codon:yes gene_type:complete